MSRDDAALWASRFETPPAPEARRLGDSLRFDRALVEQDVEAGIAHVRALEDARLLDGADAAALEKALREVGAAIADGSFQIHPADEDVHSAVERGVTELLGELGARLHAARSRNDLVATDLRLWTLAAARRLDALTTLLVRVLIDRAKDNAETVMPGTTHARPAQPVTLGHHLLAHAWALLRDLGRLDDWSSRACVSPLGAGALATSTLEIDPAGSARRLGFDSAFGNSIDAVSDRDFIVELLAVGAILAMHLSRLAADLARWTDPALGWAELDEAHSTGSSMMPNKRNPDTAELVRAKAARVTGDFVTASSTLQGLPLGYQRDLQEGTEPVLDAVQTLILCLEAIAGAVQTLRLDAAAMRSAADAEELYATDLAEDLVARGVPFREAHRRIGGLLQRLASDRRSLRALTQDEWNQIGVPGGAAMLDPDRSVRARSTPGGPSPDSVRTQIETMESALAARTSGAGS